MARSIIYPWDTWDRNTDEGRKLWRNRLKNKISSLHVLFGVLTWFAIILIPFALGDFLIWGVALAFGHKGPMPDGLLYLTSTKHLIPLGVSFLWTTGLGIIISKKVRLENLNPHEDNFNAWVVLPGLFILPNYWILFWNEELKLNLSMMLSLGVVMLAFHLTTSRLERLYPRQVEAIETAEPEVEVTPEVLTE